MIRDPGYFRVILPGGWRMSYLWSIGLALTFGEGGKSELTEVTVGYGGVVGLFKGPAFLYGFS